jgi:N-acetylglucosaminyldiphosphoundecaprenol N-acetyl-beta-D-mannosaminyltransferase
LSESEDQEITNDIKHSGAKILFVGLGCPKQERWMAEHTLKLPVVMLGVGAAFDFIAGTKPQAPAWMQNAGLEWLFRLATEPRRLWKRYLYHNPRFIYYFARQLLGIDRY